MYNSTSTSAALDSKYSVADILTSMANGEPITPSFGGALPSFSTSVPTGTTPVLTPSTIASIEQTFVNLQNQQPSGQRQSSGFIPPLVNPVTNSTMVKREYEYTDDSSQDPDWEPIPAKRPRGNGVINIQPQPTNAAPVKVKNTPGRKRQKDTLCTPEEEAKRKLRRERNKMAAAKCRQRRVDQTNTLLEETEGLEEEQAKLENEISTLQQQKEQLEFLLEAHKPVCNAKKLQQNKIVAKSNGAKFVVPASLATSRPTSLPIPRTIKSVTEATGVAITTPSSGVFATLGLDSMVDGHTGLTPITGAPSCASEVHRTSSASESSSEGMASPTLMAL